MNNKDKSKVELLEYIDGLEKQMDDRDIAIDLMTERQIGEWKEILEAQEEEFDNVK